MACHLCDEVPLVVTYCGLLPEQVGHARGLGGPSHKFLLSCTCVPCLEVYIAKMADKLSEAYEAAGKLRKVTKL